MQELEKLIEQLEKANSLAKELASTLRKISVDDKPEVILPEDSRKKIVACLKELERRRTTENK